MLAAGAVALPVAAAAMPAGAMPFYDPRLGRDARFWALHREWEQVLADAEEDADESDEAFDRWSDRINEVETAMMLTPVTTAAAVHAKYLVDKGRTEATYERGGQEFTTGQLIEWDLERLIKQELWA
jgi:hypothetical protein